MHRNARNGFVHLPLRSAMLLLGTVGLSGLLAAPLAAQAARDAQTAVSRSSSICSKVSPGSVSAIVGYSVPAATTSVRTLPATAQDGGISAVVTTCTFGPDASLAELLKDVTLTLEVTTKPLTTAEVKKDLQSKSNASLKITVKAYSGLGVPGLYYAETGAGITGQGISGAVGNRLFGASVEQPLAMSKLASLAKLAGKL
jgi:hypothetical protein